MCSVAQTDNIEINNVTVGTYVRFMSNKKPNFTFLIFQSLALFVSGECAVLNLLKEMHCGRC